MIIILIRHGECLSNLNNKKFSISDDNTDILTPKGKNQAKETGKLLNNLLKDRHFEIFSSPLIRAAETAKIIKNQLTKSKPIVINDHLIEKNKIESFDDVNVRFKQFLQTFSNKNILLIVTHGHVIQAVSSKLLNAKYPEKIDVANCGITIIVDNNLICLNSNIHTILLS